MPPGERLVRPTLRRAALAALVLTLLNGCATIGGQTVRRDRIDYAEAIAASWKEQTLSNIVRLRYADAPVFLDVGSVIASYTLEGSATLGASIIAGPGDNTNSASVQGIYSDRPTITYTPMQGEKFAKMMLRPISPVAIFSLLEAGYSADVIFPITLRAINGVYNHSSRPGKPRRADKDFHELLEAMRRVQQSESISMRLEKRGAEEAGIVVFRDAVSPEVAEDLRYIGRTLRLKPEAGEFHLTYGAIQREDTEIAVLSRSMIDILLELSAGIDAPAAHMAEGRTFKPIERGTSPHDRPLIKIRSGTARPQDAYVATHYREHWFWIDDRDFQSKIVFVFLNLLFSLSETGIVPQMPVITVPAG
jgi:hypothetical protein